MSELTPKFKTIGGKPPYKTCYGKKLTDDWARNLVSPVEESVPVFIPKSKVEKVLAYLKTI